MINVSKPSRNPRKHQQHKHHYLAILLIFPLELLITYMWSDINENKIDLKWYFIFVQTIYKHVVHNRLEDFWQKTTTDTSR